MAFDIPATLAMEAGRAMLEEFMATLDERGFGVEGRPPGLPALTAVFGLAKACSDAADEYAAALSNMAGVGLETLDCREGCNHCCRMTVMATPAEILLILDAFNDLEDVQSVSTRIHVAAKRVSGMADAAERMASGVFCPLLGKDGICLVYQARPIACRTYFSRSVTECARSAASQDKDAGVMHAFPAQMAGAVVSAALIAMLHRAGIDGAPVELIQGLSFVMRQEPEHTLAWASGKARFLT